jgi:hypothetical protein
MQREVNKRTAAKSLQNGSRNRPHDRLDKSLTRAAVTLETILKKDGKLAELIKAEWPAWELWRFRKGIRRPCYEGRLVMKRVTGGRIQLEHWNELVTSVEAPNQVGEI